MKSEDKAGLYITVIVHLAVIIVLLASGIGHNLNARKADKSEILMDFSQIEKFEKMAEEVARLEAEAAALQQELDFQEAIKQKLQQDLQDAGAQKVHNVVVDRGQLKDDRGTNADQLYADNAKLQQSLRDGFDYKEDATADVSEDPAASEPVRTVKTSAPSVLSYNLEGRRATRLPVPAYRGYLGGEVKVIITVDRSGKVVSAKVDESASVSDRQLRSLAVEAALKSHFNASTAAPDRQQGDIIYLFVAQ